MYRGRRDAEEIQEVALCRRPPVQGRIGVDEGQVLALSRGESDRHAVRCVIRCVAEEPRCTYDTSSSWRTASVSTWKHRRGRHTGGAARETCRDSPGGRGRRIRRRDRGHGTRRDLGRLSHQAALRRARIGTRLIGGGASRRETETRGHGGSPPGRHGVCSAARWAGALDAGAARGGSRPAHDTYEHFARDDRPPLGEEGAQPWQVKMWCVPRIDATYVARMEDVLGRYTTLPRRILLVLDNLSTHTRRRATRRSRPPKPACSAAWSFTMCRSTRAG
jgi:hypothetical protein